MKATNSAEQSWNHTGQLVKNFVCWPNDLNAVLLLLTKCYNGQTLKYFSILLCMLHYKTFIRQILHGFIIHYHIRIASLQLTVFKNAIFNLSIFISLLIYRYLHHWLKWNSGQNLWQPYKLRNKRLYTYLYLTHLQLHKLKKYELMYFVVILVRFL